MRRWLLQVLFIGFAFFSVERFCHKQTKGFRLQKIQAKLSYNADWETSLPADCDLEKLRKVLSQPFHFLDSGGQCYAFVSKDGRYVLKFFKLHHMRPGAFEEKFFPKAVKMMRAQKLNHLFSSCKLSYEIFRPQTGLIYLHLNQTDHLQARLALYDAIGTIHHLDLDTVPFALQEKAQLAYPALSALAEAKEHDLAKKRLYSLIDLIAARCQSGLVDHDARARNFGFIGDRAIELDIGSFTFDEKIKTPTESRRILLHESAKLRRYLKKRHPELLSPLDERIQTYLTDPPRSI